MGQQSFKRLILTSRPAGRPTLLLANGTHARVVQELMRHSDIRLTTRLYTDASQLPLAAGLAALPSFGLPKLPELDAQKDAQIYAQTAVQGVPAVSRPVMPASEREGLQSA